MKMRCYLRLFLLLSISTCAGNMQGAVQAITGGRFDPPLVPTTNMAWTVNSRIDYRVIVDAATLTGLEINGVLYSDVEGPTNAVVHQGGILAPFNAPSYPGSQSEALTNLTLYVASNISTATVMFASTVTTETDGGFFVVDYNLSDDINVYPLNSNGERIGNWQLYLPASSLGTYDLLMPHGLYLSLKYSASSSTPDGEGRVGGAAFTLTDFTGGSGVLNNVKGLEFVDPDPAFDLAIAGIYRGPGQSVLSLAGRASRMWDASFTATSGNPITNDFDFTGFGGASSITAPASVIQFDTRPASYLLYPEGGIAPSSTIDSLLGFGMNGIRNITYWDFMFEEPVTNANDGFFIIEDAIGVDLHYVYPLDVNRQPISTYAIAALPGLSGYLRYDMSPFLLGSSILIDWSGNGDGGTAGQSRPGGIVMPLSAFSGGTGGLTEVYGIRVYDSLNTLDPLVVGSYKASPAARLVYNVETDPTPMPLLADNHVSSSFRHNWTLTSITLESGRYTNLEGPTSVANSGGGAYWIYGTDMPSSAAAAVTGLTSRCWGNFSTLTATFDTTVTNGFDGGFFLFEFAAGEDNVTVLPLDANGSEIAGYSLVLNNDPYCTQKPEDHSNINWDYTNGDGTIIRPYGIFGCSFTLNSFTNAAGESLTSDVKGLKLIDSTPSFDLIVAGIYKGPADPPAPAGYSLPMKGATLSPQPTGSPYSTDTAVTGVESAESVSSSVRGPVDVAVLYHRSNRVYFPKYGSNPDPNDGNGNYLEGYTNALVGLDMNGVLYVYWSDYMFDKPVKQENDGFFIMKFQGNDVDLVRPLDANRIPISTYAVQIDRSMYALSSNWLFDRAEDINDLTGAMYGTVIRKSDFAGGTGELGPIYGLRIEHPVGLFHPGVVGQWFGPLEGTVILVR